MDNTSFKNFIKALNIPFSYSCTRIHPLISFDTQDSKVFIKRDDEYGGIINGSKKRKYLSLVDKIKNVDEWIILGSAYSNHVLAITQLAIELKITPILLLDKEPPKEKKGNYFLTSLLVNQGNIHYLNMHSNREEEALKLKESREKMGKQLAIIPFGGSGVASISGSMTLACEVLYQQSLLDLNFDHIFIDAGTGFTAGCLIAGLSHLNSLAHFHVVLMADEEKAFKNRFFVINEHLKTEFNLSIQDKISISCYKAVSAKSFGSINSTVSCFIKEVAEKEGIFLDPLYNAKLFLTAKNLIQELNLKGNILLIHSGGTASLLGFNELL